MELLVSNAHYIFPQENSRSSQGLLAFLQYETPRNGLNTGAQLPYGQGRLELHTSHVHSVYYYQVYGELQ